MSSVQYLDALVANSIGRPRLYAGLLTVFAGLALVLALSGTYGLSAALVSTRRREMGVRMCLGARPSRVMGSVLGESIMCVLAGIGVGLAGALLTAGALSGLFVGVEAFEWPPYLASGVLLLGTGVLANLAPARQTMTMNPAAVLSEHEGERGGAGRSCARTAPRRRLVNPTGNESRRQPWRCFARRFPPRS